MQSGVITSNISVLVPSQQVVIISLIKSLPLIVKTFSDAIKGMKGDKNTGKLRTEQDIDMKAIAIGIVVVTIAIWLIPDIPVTILGAILIVIFGFLLRNSIFSYGWYCRKQ